MSEIELRPCPFCGSEGVICNRFEDVHYVECLGCSAKVESYNGLEDAVAGWNTRAIDRDELLKIADELESIYDSHGETDHADCFVERIMKAIGE